MAKSYQIRPSELVSELFDISGTERFLVDELALTDSVQEYFNKYLEGLKKSSKRVTQKKERQEKPPPPQFVNPKFWKGKKWDKWSK